MSRSSSTSRLFFGRKTLAPTWPLRVLLSCISYHIRLVGYFPQTLKGGVVVSHRIEFGGVHRMRKLLYPHTVALVYLASALGQDLS